MFKNWISPDLVVENKELFDEIDEMILGKYIYNLLLVQMSCFTIIVNIISWQSDNRCCTDFK